MRITSIALIVSFLTLSAGNALAQEAGAWRKVADAIPLGSKVKVQTLEGKRITGTLMRADETTVAIKKNTRLPEAAVIVTYDAISNLERDHGGMNWAKALGIGAAAGAGAILTIFVIALQLD
jgi:SH3-like domain-containing protein